MSASSIVKENEEHEDQKNKSESNQAQIKSIQSTTETPPRTNLRKSSQKIQAQWSNHSQTNL